MVGVTTSLGPITTTGGTVWMADNGSPLMYRIDALGAKPAATTTDLAHGGALDIAASTRAVWLLHDDGYVTRIDAATGALLSTQVLAAGTAIAATDDWVWAADRLGSKVASIDPITGRPQPSISVRGRPAGVAIASDGSVWVTIQAP
jgi:DNA-binding beta-propeller fold protein YncE